MYAAPVVQTEVFTTLPKTRHITEAEHGVILKAQLPVPGEALYSHA